MKIIPKINDMDGNTYHYIVIGDAQHSLPFSPWIAQIPGSDDWLQCAYGKLNEGHTTYKSFDEALSSAKKLIAEWFRKHIVFCQNQILEVEK